jgi:hypothetical protein
MFLIDADELIHELNIEAYKYINAVDKDNIDFIYNNGKVAGIGTAKGIVESLKYRGEASHDD